MRVWNAPRLENILVGSRVWEDRETGLHLIETPLQPSTTGITLVSTFCDFGREFTKDRVEGMMDVLPNACICAGSAILLH